jgi:putative ABC transport system permease protein
VNWQLLKKLLRDLRARKGSLSALSLVGVLGISFLIGSYGVYFDLRDARDQFYDGYALADFRVTVKAVPENLVRFLEDEPGVARMEGGVSLDARIDMAGFPDPVQATLVGVPRGGKVFNRLLPTDGGTVEELSDDRCFASSAFFAAHHLSAGDSLNVILLGQRQSFQVAGGVQSPEFVYVLAPGGGLAPDPLRTAVLFLPLRQLQEAGELENSYNQILGRFSEDVRGRPEREAEVLGRLEKRLEPYGVLEAVPRSQFLSVQFLESDIVGLKVSSSVMPSLCLIIVAVVLNVVIGRLVAGQRTIVGTLKALGYSTTAVTVHYLGFGLVVGGVGAVGGVALGLALQGGLLSLYRTVYELPIAQPKFYPQLVGISVGLSLGFALLGTSFGVRAATRLAPAVAMRPPPPEKGGRILLERGPFRPLWSALPFSLKLILRAIFRNPFRSCVTFGSSFVATTIMVEALAMGSSISVLIDREFRQAQRQDVTILLREPEDRISVRRELETLPGVQLVETQLSVPATLIAHLPQGDKRRQVVIQGLPAHPVLENPLRLTPALRDGMNGDQNGIYLSRKLAELLGVRVGDRLEVELRRGTRRTVGLSVAGLVDTSLGLGSYARADRLARLIGENAVTDKILLQIDPEMRPLLVARMWDRPEVLSLTWRADSLVQMERTLQQNMGTMLTVIIVFCGFLAFGAVLNTALVALAEREREVGTLRVLGYTPFSVTAIFSGESLLLNSLGVACGWWGGAALTYAITRAYDTEIFRIPFVFNPWIVAKASAVMLAFLVASQLVLGLIVRRLPWLEVLKIRE